MLLILVALVLPNAVFLAIDLAGIGIQPRVAAICGYALVALLARRVRWGLVIGLYLLVLGFDLVGTVAASFNLTPFEMMAALRFSAHIDVGSSLFYAFLVIAIGALTMVTLWLTLSGRSALRQARLLPMMVLLILGVGADFLWKKSSDEYFSTAVAKDEPFESAVRNSGFEAALLNGTPGNALIVIVESLGVLADPDQQAHLMAPFADPLLRAQYNVTQGDVRYFGSTTAGEMRELCASRRPYTDYLDTAPTLCLPAALAAHGYRVTGVHGFTGDMFERLQWWPKIGIEHRIFGPDLPEMPQCGSVFRGVCDTRLIETVSAALDAEGGPAFVYWLTLNSHIPLIEADCDGGTACEAKAPFSRGSVDALTEMWRDLFVRIVALAQSRELEVLVVGDHGPPLLLRRQREMFVPGKVPWVRLAPRESGP